LITAAARPQNLTEQVDTKLSSVAPSKHSSLCPPQPVEAVTGRNCHRPKLSLAKAVTGQNHHWLKLSPADAVTGQSCHQPKLSSAKTVISQNCHQPKQSSVEAGTG
jgi:hypothetical protein